MSAMLSLMPLRQNDTHRLHEYVVIAVTVARACGDNVWCASVLTAVGHFESGYVIHARGRMGEVGPWQLMGAAPDMRLIDQAREAWRRWNVQRPEGYTGEGKCPCPLAEHRRLEAAIIRAVFGTL